MCLAIYLVLKCEETSKNEKKKKTQIYLIYSEKKIQNGQLVNSSETSLKNATW